MSYESEILSSVAFCSKVKVIRISKPAGFIFKPGQWLSIWCSDFKEGDRPVRRAFSIASSPDDDFLELCISRGKGLSAHLQDLPINSKINFDGPFGTYFLRPAKKYMFIAGGSGIAPFIPLIKEAISTGKQVLLLYSIKHLCDFAYKSLFDSFSANFKLVLTVTQEQTEFKNERITEFLHEFYDSDFDVYICGPPMMISSIEEKLSELGHPKDHIFTEKWV